MPSLLTTTACQGLCTLIRARIAGGLTHRQLAERVGLPEQAVQRDQVTDFVEIADALEVTVHGDVRLSQAG